MMRLSASTDGRCIATSCTLTALAPSQIMLLFYLCTDLLKYAMTSCSIQHAPKRWVRFVQGVADCSGCGKRTCLPTCQIDCALRPGMLHQQHISSDTHFAKHTHQIDPASGHLTVYVWGSRKAPTFFCRRTGKQRLQMWALLGRSAVHTSPQ